MDVDAAHMQLDSHTAVEESQGPRAVLTPFGWIVAGKVPSSIQQGPSPRRIYADNLLDSFDNDEQAIKFSRNAIKSLQWGASPLINGSYHQKI
jgi:hypothetical protein